MPILEHHDELGVPWDDLVDGRLHRLVRGVDFFRSPEAVEQAAKNAGRRLGKVARVVPEVRHRKVFVWVHFSDYETELGQPCPRCGSVDLRALNRQHTECASCRATVILMKPKKAREEPEGFGTGLGGELLAALLAPSASSAGGVPGRGKGRAPTEVSAEKMSDLMARARETVPMEERRQWTRRSFNELAAIVSTGLFAPDGSPVSVFEADQEVRLSMLLEVGTKQLEARGGVVFNDVHGHPRYRIVDGEFQRIRRPGRYTFTVTIPPRGLAEGVYDARTVFAFVQNDRFSRITRRSAFSFAVTNGEPMQPWGGDPQEEIVFHDDYDWVVEPGDGPWRAAAQPPIPPEQADSTE
jgi:hypothetical protein